MSDRKREIQKKLDELKRIDKMRKKDRIIIRSFYAFFAIGGLFLVFSNIYIAQMERDVYRDIERVEDSIKHANDTLKQVIQNK